MTKTELKVGVDFDQGCSECNSGDRHVPVTMFQELVPGGYDDRGILVEADRDYIGITLDSHDGAISFNLKEAKDVYAALRRAIQHTKSQVSRMNA